MDFFLLNEKLKRTVKYSNPNLINRIRKLKVVLNLDFKKRDVELLRNYSSGRAT